MAAIYLPLMVQLTGTKSVVGQINDIVGKEVIGTRDAIFH